MNEHDEAIDVSKAMIKYGGSFVNLLGQLIQKADDFNKQKTKITWPEYWNEYKVIAKKERKRFE